MYIAFVCCMSPGFIAKGYGLPAPFGAWLSRATLLALLADLDWYVFVGFRLGRGCWVGVPMNASGLLNFRRCCALRLAGKRQVGIISICVFLKGVYCPVVSLLHDSSNLLVLLVTGMHPMHLVGSLLKPFVQQRYACYQSSYLQLDDCSLTACGRCRLDFGRWGRLVGLLLILENAFF